MARKQDFAPALSKLVDTSIKSNRQPDTMYLVPGTRYLVRVTRYLVPGTRSLVTGTWYLVFLIPDTSQIAFPNRAVRLHWPIGRPDCCSQLSQLDSQIAFHNRSQSVQSAELGRLGARWSGDCEKARLCPRSLQVSRPYPRSLQVSGCINQ